MKSKLELRLEKTAGVSEWIDKGKKALTSAWGSVSKKAPWAAAAAGAGIAAIPAARKAKRLLRVAGTANRQLGRAKRISQGAAPLINQAKSAVGRGKATNADVLVTHDYAPAVARQVVEARKASRAASLKAGGQTAATAGLIGGSGAAGSMATSVKPIKPKVVPTKSSKR